MPRLVRLCHAFPEPCHHVPVMVPRAGSDIDIAASFDPLVPAAFEVDVPAGIDLLILNTAPLEICGRIALHGQLVLEVDPAAVVDDVRVTRLQL